MPLKIMHQTDLVEELAKSKASSEIIEGVLQMLNTIKDTVAAPNSSKNIRQKLYELGFKKKKFEKKILYTVNVDVGEGKHRLVFERLQSAKTTFLILRSIVLHHDYKKALRWQPFSRQMDRVTTQWLNQQNYTTLVNTEIDSEEESELASPIINYGNEYVSLSTTQTDVLNQSIFPQLLIGPPGSGKTLLIHAFFQEQVLQHLSKTNAENISLRLLCLTESSALANSHREKWQAWKKNVFGSEELKFTVSFESFDSFNRRIITYSSAEAKNNNYVSNDEYLEIIKCRLKQNPRQKMSISADRILEETIHSAYVLNKDIEENKDYDDSDYKKLGINEISVGNEHKHIIYELYKNIASKPIDTMTLGQIAEEDKYDFVCVDEAQKSPMQKLINTLIIAKNHQVIYCGDSHQRGCVRVPSLQLLAHNFRKLQLQLHEAHLPSSHRLKPRLAKFCSELIKLEDNLRGGLTDKTSYASLDSVYIDENDSSLCWVDTYNGSYKDLKNKASFAALTLDSKDIETAKTLTGSATVMLAEDSQGLEYEEVFIYVSKETQKEFNAASRKMQEKQINPLTPLDEALHPSPDKNADSKNVYAIFSKFFIALSRSLGTVHIYFEGSKKIIDTVSSKSPLKTLLTWMKLQCHDQIEMAIQHSSPEEWIKFINKLISTHEEHILNIAKSNLQENFSLSEETSKNYINFYLRLKPSAAECLEWIESTKVLPNKIEVSVDCLKEEASPESPVIPQKEASTSHRARNKHQIEVSLPSKATTVVAKNIEEKRAKYLRGLWDRVDVVENIKLLLKSPKLNDYLFVYKMENGKCFFDNLIFSPTKLSYFISIAKKIKIESQLPNSKKKKQRNRSQDSEELLNLYKNFIEALGHGLKVLREHDEKKVNLLEYYSYLDREVANRLMDVVAFFWQDLIKNSLESGGANILTSNDLKISGSHICFISHVINHDRYHILNTDAATMYIHPKDIADSLWYIVIDKKSGKEIQVFDKVFTREEGLQFIKIWYSKIIGYIDTITAARRLVNAYPQKLNEEQIQLKNILVMKGLSYLFDKINIIEGYKEVIKRLKIVHELLKYPLVHRVIAKSDLYLDILLVQESRLPREIWTCQLEILSTIIESQLNSGNILKRSISTLLTLIDFSQPEEIISSNLEVLSAFVRRNKKHIALDDFGLIPSVLPFLNEEPYSYQDESLVVFNMDKIYSLQILNVLAENPINFDIFIQHELPEKIAQSLLCIDECLTHISNCILSRLVEINFEVTSRNISTKSKLNLSRFLLEPDQRLYKLVLILLNYLNLEEIADTTQLHYLLHRISFCYVTCDNSEINELILDTFEQIIDAGIEPIVLPSKALQKLVQQSRSSTSNKQLNNILTFFKKVDENNDKIKLFELLENSISVISSRHSFYPPYSEQQQIVVSPLKLSLK